MLSSTSIPRITTDRLVLRGFGSQDFDAYAAMMADPDVTRFLGEGKPLKRTDAWRQLAMIIGHWSLRGFGLWAVEEKSTGVLIGRVGFFEPEGWPGFELGFALAKPAWGRGYATEAALAALDYGSKGLQRQRVISLVRRENEASIRVAARMGAVLEEIIDFNGYSTSIYVYPKVAEVPERDA